MQSSIYPAPRNRFAVGFAVLTLFAMLAGIAPRPARADSASTTAVLLGAAAAAAAIIISNNVRHKQAQANTPVGRTQDGGTVFGDGRVVYPNGDVLYTGNGNGRSCTYDGYGVPCNNQSGVYYPSGYNGATHGYNRDSDRGYNGANRGYNRGYNRDDNRDDKRDKHSNDENRGDRERGDRGD